MATIDPSPDAEEIAKIQECLKSVSDALTDYLETEEGEADPNFDALSDAGLNLNADIANIATIQLDLATASGGHAVDVINQATKKLNDAIATRAAITKDLTIIANVVAFAAAVYANDIGGIITSGSSLIDAV